jgi:hypothetical protein
MGCVRPLTVVRGGGEFEVSRFDNARASAFLFVLLLATLHSVIAIASPTQGALDISFDPGDGANGPIRAMALLPDGKILIGGGFTHYGAIPRFGMARILPTGALDPTFTVGAGISGVTNASVSAIIVQKDG